MIVSRSVISQYLICISVNLGSCLICGSINGWGTAVVPTFTDPDSPNALNESQIGWVMSSVGVGVLVGPLLTWLLVDRIGRRSLIALGVVPIVVAYALMAVKSEYAYLLVGRALSGAGSGIIQATVPLYVGEVSDTNIRGSMGVVSTVTDNLGMLIPVIVGPYLSLTQLNTLCAVMAFVLAFMFMLIPESPYFYAMKGKHDEANRSLKRLRCTKNVDAELKVIAEYVEQRKCETSTIVDVFTNGSTRRPFVILTILMAMRFYGGMMSLPTYAYTIFGDSGTEISLDLLVMIMECVTVIGSVVGIYTVHRLGRRSVLFLMSAIIFICLIVNGIFYTLKSQQYDVSSFTIVPLISVIVYVTSNACGLHSLPAILLSEYFSTTIKAKVAMMYAMLMAIFAASSVKIFLMSYNGIGPGATFFICSGFIVIGTGVLYFIMPETKGRSFRNIEDIHRGRSYGTDAHYGGTLPTASMESSGL